MTARLWVIEWKRKGVREAWKALASRTQKRDADSYAEILQRQFAPAKFRVRPYERVEP